MLEVGGEGGSKYVRLMLLLLLSVNTVFVFPPFVTFQILSQTLQFEETGLRRAAVQWAGELAVLRAEGRGSGLGGSGVEHSVERRGGVEGRVSWVTRAT